MRCPWLGAVSLVVVSAAMSLTGCRAYEARPIDLTAMRQAWAARSVADESVALFARELAERGRLEMDGFDVSDGLSLREAQAVALLLNPGLRHARLRAQVPLVGARLAGRWEDPQLSFDVLRVLSSVEHPWIAGGAVGLTLPVSGRLAVERDLAWADYGVAWREAAIAEWRLLGELQAAWMRWSASVRLVELHRTYLERLAALATTVEHLAEAGELTRIEARMLRMDVMQRRIELGRMHDETERERVALLAMLGLTPDAEVTLQPTVEAATVSLDELPGDTCVEAHPEVAAAMAAYAVAEQHLRREIHRQYPDVTLGPAFEWEEGQSRLGLGGGLPIPLWNRNSQAIAEAEAAREAAAAAVQEVMQRVTHELERQVRTWQSARRRRTALQEEVAPLVDEQLATVSRLIDAGEVNVLILRDVLEQSLETKQAILEAMVEEAIAAAAVDALVRPRWAMEPAAEAAKENE